MSNKTKKTPTFGAINAHVQVKASFAGSILSGMIARLLSDAGASVTFAYPGDRIATRCKSLKGLNVKMLFSEEL